MYKITTLIDKLCLRLQKVMLPLVPGSIDIIGNQRVAASRVDQNTCPRPASIGIVPDCIYIYTGVNK